MDEWTFEFTGFDPVDEGRREALCTLANGLLGTRGAAAESRDDGIHYPGAYVAGVFNRLVSTAHGKTLEHESMANLPNWLPLTFRAAGGAWLDRSRQHVLEPHQRLDLRRGIFHRRFCVEDASGRRTLVAERRIVSMDDPNLAALEWTITPENWSGSLALRTGIDGGIENRNVPDEHELAGRHLRVVARDRVTADAVLLVAETTQSHIRVAVAARTRIIGADVVSQVEWSPEDMVGSQVTVPATEGEPIVVEKVAAVFTGRDPAISEPGLAAVEAVTEAGDFADLLGRHVAAWERRWRRFRLEVTGADRRTSRILNLHLFHTMQTLSPHVAGRDLGVPARGLHGEAYRGHLFWDEMYVYPLLDLRHPELTGELLLYRYRRLGGARHLARDEGRRGAMFPWQSGSDGREETPTQLWNPRSRRWMADNSRRQRHVGLAVAHSVWRHVEWTGDTRFLAEQGIDVLVEVARFFADLADLDPRDGRYHIRGVMGPDEFHDGYPHRPGEGIDDNAYTNVMAAWLLRRTTAACEALRDVDGGEALERLDVDDAELDRWGEIAGGLFVPFLGDGVIAQFAGFGDLEELDWALYRRRYGNVGRLDLILESEDDSPNRYQGLKQADTLMLLYLFTPEQLSAHLASMGYQVDEAALRRTVDYYLARTSHGSSLSRVAHAWVLAHYDVERSWEMLLQGLECDVADTQGGTVREGIHLGLMAGTVDVVQRCYTGLGVDDGVLVFAPRLPEALEGIRFPMRFRGHRLDVEVTKTGVSVASHPGDASPIQVAIGTDRFTLETGKEVARST